MFSASPPSQSSVRTLTAPSAQLQESGFVKMNSKDGKSSFFTKRVVQSSTVHTCLLKSIVLNSWQHTFPWSPFGQEILSRHPGRAAALGRFSRQRSGLYQSHGQSSFSAEPRLFCHLITTFLGFQHYCTFFWAILGKPISVFWQRYSWWIVIILL